MSGHAPSLVHSWSASWFRLQRLRWLVWRVLATLVLTVVLFHLGRLQSYGGDGAYIARLAGTDWTIIYHLYLTSIMHRVVYLIASPFSFSAWECVSISSSVAGALAVQVLVAYSRNPLFLMPNLCAGSFLVFVGQVEAYAWVNLFLLLTFIEAQRTLEQGAPVWRLLACWSLAASFHLLALFYLLPVMWVLRKRQPFSAWQFGVPLGLFLLCYFVASQAMPSTGFEMDMRRFVPLTEPTRPDH